jgi:hypothetical protein
MGWNGRWYGYRALDDSVGGGRPGVIVDGREPNGTHRSDGGGELWKLWNSGGDRRKCRLDRADQEAERRGGGVRVQRKQEAVRQAATSYM